MLIITGAMTGFLLLIIVLFLFQGLLNMITDFKREKRRRLRK